ncbi:MAG: Uncharacterised protein [Gammaproteobacteria bacterium]|nr:MAG: Uncharacterised protein [Gammaproteobacteria bacterium]
MFVAMQYLDLQFSCTAKKSYPSLVCDLQICILNPGGLVMPLIIFMLVPVIEMWILIEVGGWVGALPTIGLVVLTATLGLSLLKRQGLSTLMSARRKMDEGSIPASELVSGVMIGVGGALLLTPGFITDAVGFALLMPQARHWLLIKLIDRYRDKIVIEGEFHRVDDRNF